MRKILYFIPYYTVYCIVHIRRVKVQKFYDQTLKKSISKSRFSFFSCDNWHYWTVYWNPLLCILGYLRVSLLFPVMQSSRKTLYLNRSLSVSHRFKCTQVEKNMELYRYQCSCFVVCEVSESPVTLNSEFACFCICT